MFFFLNKNYQNTSYCYLLPLFVIWVSTMTRSSNTNLSFTWWWKKVVMSPEQLNVMFISKLWLTGDTKKGRARFWASKPWRGLWAKHLSFARIGHQISHQSASREKEEARRIWKGMREETDMSRQSNMQLRGKGLSLFSKTHRTEWKHSKISVSVWGPAFTKVKWDEKQLKQK